MGRLFIDNDHDDVDEHKYYYCRCCKHTHNNNVEFGSGSKCTAIECESGEASSSSYLVFLDISFNNIEVNTHDQVALVEIHPDLENKFILLDLDPVPFPGQCGAVREINCRCCRQFMGYVLVNHPMHTFYEKLFFIKRDAVL